MTRSADPGSSPSNGASTCSERIVLALQPPFDLGTLRVVPAHRQVSADGLVENLEPRVMQVLVALAGASGRVVTRDELFDRCWEGRVVGENSLHRVISRLRQLAAGLAGGSFTVETIPKVGYSFGFAGAIPGLASVNTTAVPRVDRRWLLGAFLALGGAGLAGGFLARPKPSHQPSDMAQLLFKKAKELQDQSGVEETTQSVAYLVEATRLEPEYSAAWGALAISYRNLLEFGPRDDAQVIEQRSRGAAANALRLDEGNLDASAALILLTPFFGNWGRIESQARALLRAHPDHILLRSTLGWLMCEVGRWREAIPILEEANARDPFLPIARYRLTIALWSAGRLGEAEAAVEDALIRWPRHSALWQTKFRLLSHSGRPEAALQHASDVARQPTGYSASKFEPSVATARAIMEGTPERRNLAISRNLKAVRDDPSYVHSAAQNCASLGAADVALALLNGYLLGQGPWANTRPTEATGRRYTSSLFNPVMKTLHAEPRFDLLLRAIGLEEYWRSVRAPPDFRLGRVAPSSL